MFLRATLALVSICSAVAARADVPSLLDRSLVESLAGAAAHGPVALVESKPDGTMRQVTLVVFVRAPAEAVHALVADVGGYLRFVPNLRQADFRRDEAGRWVNTWRLELPIASFSGRDLYEIDPAPLGPIRFHSMETLASYQWGFVPVAGGTLLVQAGYTDVLHANRFVRAFVRKVPALEHGLALAAQYMLVSAVRDEAERRTPARARVLPSANAKALEALSARGQVVVMRADDDGKLAEVSALERVFAPERRVREVLVEPGAYQTFIAGVDRSIVTEHSDGEVSYVLEMGLPIVTWTTTYAMKLGVHTLDGAGVDGDLRGARYRWDLAARGPKETLVTYRAKQPLARGSILVKKLFEVDPSLEAGLNVAFALLQTRSVRGRAEGWATK